MPISGSDLALMYSRMGTSANVAPNPLGPLRMGASRMGYYNPVILVKVGGTARYKNFNQFGWSISDQLNEQPNEASLEVFGFTPTVGQELLIALGSPTNPLFKGTITGVTEAHAKLHARTIFKITAADWTHLLNRRQITTRWTSTSASTIAQEIISNYTSGFTATYVEAGLATLDDFPVTFSNAMQALQRLANRIGATMFFDDEKRLHFFVTADPQGGSTPQAINGSNTRFRNFRYQRDLSQVRTRVWVEGKGSIVTANVAIGATTIPVEDASMFESSGTNYAKLGPFPQVITYTGKQEGGGSSTVTGNISGPGACTAALAAGAGYVTAGAHRWKIGFANASGETVPGTQSNEITAIDFAAPGALSVAAVATTIGYLIGAYGYKVTFVTALGETTGGTLASKTATAQSAPAACTVGDLYEVGPLIGSYLYKISFVSAIGETLGTASAAATPDMMAPTAAPGVTGSWSGATNYDYVFTWVGPFGESAISAVRDVDSYNLGGGITFSAGGTVPTGATGWKLYRALSGSTDYKLVKELTTTSATTGDTVADANLGERAPATSTVGERVALSVIPTGPTGTLARRVYRTKAGGSIYYLVTEIPDNSTTAFTDDVPDTSLTVSPPLQNLNGEKHSLTSIPTGATGTLARRIYRTVAGGADYKFLTEIGDNTTTTLTDNTPDSSLGGSVPLVNTAGSSKVSLTSIPIGGAGVTKRTIYRTKAGGTSYFYVGTLNDNVATTYEDSKADESLGREAPDASSIGAIAGDTSVLLADATNFPTSGWFMADSQILRYTGKTSNTLTGIPASGDGAITGAISGGLTVVALPALTGVPASGTGALVIALTPGDDCHLLVQRNDTAAQTTVAAAEGGDGIHEHYVQDRRLSTAGAIARGDAELELFSAALTTISFTTTDPEIRSGKSVAVDMTADWGISGTFRVQSVQTSMEEGSPWPQRQVTLSSQTRDFYDILRSLGGQLED